jgi:hypothetical protein
VFRWEPDEPAEDEFAGLSQTARKALAEFMDAAATRPAASRSANRGGNQPGLLQRPLPSSHLAVGLT